MFIYLIRRTTPVWYDETAGVVIIAESEDKALDFFLWDVNESEFAERKDEEIKIKRDDLSIRKIGVVSSDVDIDVTYIVLRDFKAG
jgi:hypothetical protein